MTSDNGAECAAVQAGLLHCAGEFLELDSAVGVRQATILLVEDEAFVREVTVQVLRSAGYAVLTAMSAAEAGRIYSKFSSEIDLLLSDVILPDENGRLLAQKLRSQNAELLTLLVSGYADQVETQEAALAGVECLPKPFSARTLLQKVRTVLERKRWSAGSIQSGAPAIPSSLQDLF